MIEMIRNLTRQFAPAGHETTIRKTIADFAGLSAYEAYMDSIGNLIFQRQGARSANKILLAAHMDQKGFVITSVDKEGCTRFQTIGTFEPDSLIGTKVAFGTGSYGLIVKDCTPSRAIAGGHPAMVIDIGDRNSGICVGDMAVPVGEITENQGIITGCGLQNNAGCAALLQAMSEVEAPCCDVTVVFTVQGVLNGIGARVAANSLKPIAAIALDGIPANDMPGAEAPAVCLNRGAVLALRDQAHQCHKPCTDAISQLCSKHGIPLQVSVNTDFVSDAGAMHMASDGIPTAIIGYPVRHYAQPSQMIDQSDMDNLVSLLKVILQEGLVVQR